MAVELVSIYKSFKDKDVLKGISLNIPSGTVCGLLGINGAGKSTLMKILYGLERADSGQILFDGRKRTDQKLGALIERPAIYGNLSAYDNLKTKALLYGLPRERILQVLEQIGLADTGRKKAGKFSLGMKQRLGLGMAILTQPDFLILDEPTNGLDPDGILDLLTLIRNLRNQGMTILLSSHQLSEMSKVADTIVILHGGELVYQGVNQEGKDLESLFFHIVHGGA